MKFRCENGHLVEVDANSKKAEKTMLRKANKLLVVCPYCKPENIRLTHVPENKFAGKEYVCSKSHLTYIYPFTNGMCNVEWNGQNENLEAEPAIMQEVIDAGIYKCHYIVTNAAGKSRRCNCKLKGVDSTPLAVPTTVGIKTRTRVGDIWDRAGCPEPKDSAVQIETRGGEAYDAHLQETEFGRRNKLRVKKMRKQTAKRNAKAAGEILDKPTKRSYREDGARRPRNSDL